MYKTIERVRQEIAAVDRPSFLLHCNIEEQSGTVRIRYADSVIIPHREGGSVHPWMYDIRPKVWGKTFREYYGVKERAERLTLEEAMCIAELCRAVEECIDLSGRYGCCLGTSASDAIRNENEEQLLGFLRRFF